MSWLRRRRLPLLAGLVAAIPIIAATVRAVADSWTPYGDRGVIAVRAYDVFTAHSPLVGQYTQWSEVLGRPVFSPGPLLYWLIAIPSHLLPVAATPIWMAVVNVLCVIACVLLARRRGGDALMIATAIAIPLMCRSLGSETFHDTWNPSTTLLPFAVMCFTTWSVACGEYRLLPVTVLLASFLVETHLTFVAPSVGLMAVALVGLVLHRRWSPASRAPDLRRSVGAAVVVAVVCWVAPVADQLFGSGNLRLVVRAVMASRGALGIRAGWHTIVHAIGLPPWWLGTPLTAFPRLADVTRAPGWGSQLTAAAIVVFLVAALVAGLVRRRLAVAGVAAVALVLMVTLGAGAAATPTTDALELTVDYTLWWASPAGMFVWLAVGWLAVELVVERRAGGGRGVPAQRGWRAAGPAASGGVSAGVLAAGVVAVLVAIGQPADGDRGEYRPFRTVADRLSTGLPHHRTVLVTADQSLQGLELASEVVYALQRQGATVLAQPDVANLIGGQFALGHRRYDERVDIAFDHAAPTRARLIARVRVRPPSPVSVGTFTVAVGRGGRGSGR